MSGPSWVSSCLPVSADTVPECHSSWKAVQTSTVIKGLISLLTHLHRRLWLLPGKLSPGLRPWTEVCFSIDQACQLQVPSLSPEYATPFSGAARLNSRVPSCSNLGSTPPDFLSLKGHLPRDSLYLETHNGHHPFVCSPMSTQKLLESRKPCGLTWGVR